MQAADDWSADVFGAIKAMGIGIVANVPDAGLTRLLDLCRGDGKICVVTLSTEEEGLGLSLGAWIGGERALLCMQSSGVGNCINALALPNVTHTPCLMLVTMRGQGGEANPWQVPMGQAVPSVLEQMGVACFEATSPANVVDAFRRAAALAFEHREAAAVLVAQRVIGAKRFE